MSDNWHAVPMSGSVSEGIGNPEAWLSDHGDYLYRYALSRLHDGEQAADMVQEALLAAWKGRDRFAGNSTIRTWLVGILKHKIIDHIRKEIRTRKLNEAVESDPTSSMFNANGSWAEAPANWSDNPESLVKNDQFHAVLDDCIGKLPPKQQLVFRLRELIGDDSEEVCKEAEVSATNLHVLIHRARLALRTCLEHHWFGGSRSA